MLIDSAFIPVWIGLEGINVFHIHGFTRYFSDIQITFRLAKSCEQNIVDHLRAKHFWANVFNLHIASCIGSQLKGGILCIIPDPMYALLLLCSNSIRVATKN